jgi:hypothetical protein
MPFGRKLAEQTDDQLVIIYIYTRIYKDKAIPVTGRGGPKGCDMSRLPHFLDNLLTNGGEVVSLMHRTAAL